MSRKPSKPETRIEDYLDVMTGGNAALPQPILRIEFYYAFLAGMTVELPQPILDDEKLLAKICGMEVEAPTYIPGLFPRLYAYMAKKGGQDVQVPDPILRLERYWYDYSAGEAPSVQEYTGAVPVTFTADGTPLLDFLISGNMSQTGTPTPDNPIMPQGTGEKTGNLFDKSTALLDYYINDGNGAVSKSTAYNTSASMPIDVEGLDYIYPNTNGYTGIRQWAAFYDGSGNYISGFNGYNIAKAVPSNAKTVRFTVHSSYIDAFSVNTGSTALPYEPYGYKIPISSANTTTPVYLGEVQTTREIKKLVLTGGANEDLRKNNQDPSNYLYYLRLTVDNIGARDCLCTHLMWRTGAPTDSIGCNANLPRIIYMNFGADIMDAQTSGNTVEGLKEYLAAQYAAGTPVTIWYVLATPTTGIVNEPLRKIGDYSDTLSMEQAGVSIPTANGSTTLDVETTVKPSEVYIKYRGEAVSTLSTLSAEVSSPEAITEEENPEETEEEENER